MVFQLFFIEQVIYGASLRAGIQPHTHRDDLRECWENIHQEYCFLLQEAGGFLIIIACGDHQGNQADDVLPMEPMMFHHLLPELCSSLRLGVKPPEPGGVPRERCWYNDDDPDPAVSAHNGGCFSWGHIPRLFLWFNTNFSMSSQLFTRGPSRCSLYGWLNTAT